MVSRPKKLWGIGIFILIAICLMACRVYAQGADGLYVKAKDYINQGRYDEAIAELTKVIQINPNLAEAYYLRATLYRNKNDLERAIPDYSKAIELAPDNGEYHYWRAVSYYFTKEYDKSWDDLHKAEALGYAVPSFFIADLKNASGRDK